MGINIESTMEMNIFDYLLSSQQAGARFTARVPIDLRVV